MEVSTGNDRLIIQKQQRVVSDGIQLDLNLAPHIFQCIADSTVELGNAAQSVSVLHTVLLAVVQNLGTGQELAHVSFKYNANGTEWVLEDVNLHIPAGSTVGILGGTGSGKSTLVALIPRLYEAQEGTVSVGGRPVSDYTMEHLRDAVSVVLQKNTLFSGTIRENLLWGNPGATEEQLQSACRAACADEFLSRMPDGLDTDLGQGGVNVSGGQKQRLCIARAILKQPQILILDDSTSAVDTATDAKIRQAFRADLKGATKLIIAQRVSSIADADLILVMDRGHVFLAGPGKSPFTWGGAAQFPVRGCALFRQDTTLAGIKLCKPHDFSFFPPRKAYRFRLCKNSRATSSALRPSTST